MADIPMRATTATVTEARSGPRLLFIDNIRWTMIILVLSMHACDTYSPFGNWYYTDRQTMGLGAKIFFRRLPELPPGVFHGGAVLHCGLFFRGRL
jgi:glucan biosynthesis protein C